MTSLSILVPVLDEAESLPTLVDQILATSGQFPQLGINSFEILFVDDGSRDQSWETMQRLAQSNDQVRAIRFRRNFGKAAAIRAAASHAKGDLLITMDGDLQDDPNEIPNLLRKLQEGFDLVSGWKVNRRDPWHKRFPSLIFNRLVSWLTGVVLHDHNCGLKIYRREIFDEVHLYGEMHRFIPVLAASRGFRVAELPIHHRPRQHGRSKYGSKRLIKGLLDLMTVSFLTGFIHRPQHLLGFLGLTAWFLGSLGLVWSAIYWSLRMSYFPEWPPLHQRPLLLYSLGGLLLGVQLLTSGFLAELIVAKNQTLESPYSISEKTD